MQRTIARAYCSCNDIRKPINSNFKLLPPMKTHVNVAENCSEQSDIEEVICRTQSQWRHTANSEKNSCNNSLFIIIVIVHIS